MRLPASIHLSCARAVVLALTLGLAAPAQAATIEAVVNGQAVTDYDVTQRQKMMEVTGQSLDRKSVLENLVEERLKIQEAERLGIQVSEEQVEAAFADIATRTRMSPSQLTQALGQIGIDARTLKNSVRAQIAWSSVVRQRAGREARVTDQDVFAKLDSNGTDANQEATEYTLSQVTVLGGNPMGQAASLRGRFASCEQSLESLRGLNGVVVKDLGRRRSSELSPEDAKRLAETSVGKLSTAFEADGGARMYAVCEKRTVVDQSAGKNEARQELFSEKVDIASRRMLMDLMQNAIVEYR